MHVEWLAAARLNLDQEAEYIADDDAQAAVNIVNAIVKAVEGLKRFPSKGRPGRVPGTRELVVSGTPYIIPYRIRGDSVEIIRIFHAARKWPPRF